jgi:small subunit ribosomal protein S20
LAHPKSAIKRHRQSLRRGERNQARRTAARSAVRKARELITEGSRDEAAVAVNSAASILDRAANKGTLHPNNAARRKSRLMRQLNRAQTSTSPASDDAPRRRTPKASTSGRSIRAKKS